MCMRYLYMNLWLTRFNVTYKNADCSSHLLPVSVSTSWACPVFIVSPCDLCVNVCVKQRVLHAESGCLLSLLMKMGSKLGGREERIILLSPAFLAMELEHCEHCTASADLWRGMKEVEDASALTYHTKIMRFLLPHEVRTAFTLCLNQGLFSV